MQAKGSESWTAKYHFITCLTRVYTKCLKTYPPPLLKGSLTWYSLSAVCHVLIFTEQPLVTIDQGSCPSSHTFLFCLTFFFSAPLVVFTSVSFLVFLSISLSLFSGQECLTHSSFFYNTTLMFLYIHIRMCIDTPTFSTSVFYEWKIPMYLRIHQPLLPTCDNIIDFYFAW